MEISTPYNSYFSLFPFCTLTGRGFVTTVRFNNYHVYNNLKYVLTTTWYCIKMFLLLHAWIQKGAGGSNPLPPPW